MLPLCARSHQQYKRGTYRGLQWLAAPPHCQSMKQATIGRFFTKPGGVKASEKASTVQSAHGEREALKSVNSVERKRIREVTLQSKKKPTSCGPRNLMPNNSLYTSRILQNADGSSRAYSMCRNVP